MTEDDFTYEELKWAGDVDEPGPERLKRLVTSEKTAPSLRYRNPRFSTRCRRRFPFDIDWNEDKNDCFHSLGEIMAAQKENRARCST
jgi:hypothetical protein